MHQLCLELSRFPVRQGPGLVREIPDIARELFELSSSSPSGLVWKVAPRNKKRQVGEMAGTKMKDREYYFVSIKGKAYYAHRVAYFLQTGKNPGSMVVRHATDNTLIVGWQNDNRMDDKGQKRKEYKTKRMYSYRGYEYNLRSLCELLQIKYGHAYFKIVKLGVPAEEYFAHTCGVITLSV